MPKKKTGREQTDAEIAEMWDRIARDYPLWTVRMTMRYGSNRWIEIVAYGRCAESADKHMEASARVYHTPRTPSLNTSMWKALFALHMQIGRTIDGLPPLIGY